MTEPTVIQVLEAFDSVLARKHKSKLALASAVRDCCRCLPTGEVLTIVGHKLCWIEAYCTIWGGRDWQRAETHTQRVLTLDGCLVKEPRFEVTRPDWADSMHLDGSWEGPEGGWYSVAPQQRYERLCEECEGCDLSGEKPVVLRECRTKELSEVAMYLPSALTLWQCQRQIELNHEATNLLTEAATLRLLAGAKQSNN